MDQIHINYYKTVFDNELKAIADRFEEIVKYASNDTIKVSELNRNVKAAQWLNKTYTNNIELYENM